MRTLMGPPKPAMGIGALRLLSCPEPANSLTLPAPEQALDLLNAYQEDPLAVLDHLLLWLNRSGGMTDTDDRVTD